MRRGVPSQDRSPQGCKSDRLLRKHQLLYFSRNYDTEGPFADSSVGKESAYNAKDPSSIHGSGRFPQFAVICTVKSFSVVSEAEVGVFLAFPCFSYDPVDVGNLISGSSAFSKSSLYIWKFSVHVLLKPSLKYFEHQ